MNQIHINRFWSKVQKTKTCWLWTAGKNDRGYSIFYTGKMRKGHIVAYELMVGSVPEGLELDHVCRVRHCVNPSHLEPVTHHENCKRGIGSRLECPRGHLFTDENTYKYPTVYGGINRQCKICVKKRVAERRKSLRV